MTRLKQQEEGAALRRQSASEQVSSVDGYAEFLTVESVLTSPLDRALPSSWWKGNKCRCS